MGWTNTMKWTKLVAGREKKDSSRALPPYGSTGTYWDTISDKALQNMADTDQYLKAQMKEARAQGMPPYPDSLAYDGAQKAWESREKSMQLRHRTDLALRAADHTRTNGQLYGLSVEELAYWGGHLEEIRKDWYHKTLDKWALSPESTVALLAACQKKLEKIFQDSPFLGAVKLECGYGLPNEEPRALFNDHPTEHMKVRIDNRAIAKALLTLNPEDRQPALNKFYATLYGIGANLDQNFRNHGVIYLYSMAESIERNCKDGPERLYFCDSGKLPPRLQPATTQIFPYTLLGAAHRINSALSFAEKMDLSMLDEERKTRIALREEQKLLERAR